MIPVWLTDTVTTDPDRMVYYTLLWGLEGVVLRKVGGPGAQVPEINEAPLKRRLEAQDVPVLAIIPGLFEGFSTDTAVWRNEVAMFGEALRFCQRIGCNCIVVSAFGAEEDADEQVRIGALRALGDQAQPLGIRIAVQNEAGMAYSTGRALAGLLEAVAHPAVGAAWAPVTAIQQGEDPLSGLEAVAPYLAYVRCSDGRMQGGQWQAVLPGEGEIDWQAHLQRLQAIGYTGPVSLEVDLPEPRKAGLRAAMALIRMMRASQQAR